MRHSVCNYWTDKRRGYELVHGNIQREDGEWVNAGPVRVHRLCSVAWFGLENVKGKDIHHRIPIPWLNIESNLLPITKPEHGTLSVVTRRNGISEAVLEDVLSGMED